MPQLRLHNKLRARVLVLVYKSRFGFYDIGMRFVAMVAIHVLLSVEAKTEQTMLRL